MKNILRKNKGMATVDVVMALIIMAVLVGSVGTLYYEIEYNNLKVRYTAMATYYVVNIAEHIDEINYEDVNSMTDAQVRALFDDGNGNAYPSIFKITVSVENYNNGNQSKDDIIKKVKIEAKYKAVKEEITYSVDKLKIKEL